MSLPLVSIIIPCFNGQDDVAAAIRSAFDQTYPEIEVIVVDDGSTDGCLAVIQGFGEKVHWVTGPNRGGSTARNRGLGLAYGEIIQFLDADDVLDLQKLAIQVPALLGSQADVVYSDWMQYRLGDESNKWICRAPDAGDDAVIAALARQNIQTDSPIQRKEVLLAVGGFREGLPCCQERDLFLRLPARERVSIISRSASTRCGCGGGAFRTMNSGCWLTCAGSSGRRTAACGRGVN